MLGQIAAHFERPTSKPMTAQALRVTWHTGADLGRPIECVTDMSKSRRLGFTAYQPTDDTFLISS